MRNNGVMMRVQSSLLRAVWPVCFATAITAQTPGPAAAELLALRTPATVIQWMRAHPADTFRPNLNSDREEKLSVEGTWCGVARRQFTLDRTLITRRAFFHPPGANDLRLPPDDGHHPELVQQCVLGEVLVEIAAASQQFEPALSRLQADMNQTLGESQVPDVDPRVSYPLPSSAYQRDGKQWRSAGSRWVVSWNAISGVITGAALTAAAQSTAVDPFEPVERQLQNAQRFARDAGLPPAETRHMQALLDEVDYSRHSSAPDLVTVYPFLVSWVRQSRALPPTKRAAGLYAADIVLASIPPLYGTPDIRKPISQPQLRETTAPVRAELAAAGAHFTYDEMGQAYEYSRDWMQQAFRACSVLPAAALDTKDQTG